MKKALSLSLVLLSTLTCTAIAAPLFSIRITVDPMEPTKKTETFTFSNVENVFEQIDEDELRAAFPLYDEMSSRVLADIDFRGVDMDVSFIPGRVNELVFTAPSLDVREVFTGASRDALVDQLEDFLKSEGGDILNRIQAASIAQSPVDPIAGNPGSMASIMISGQFEAGFSDQITQIIDTRATTPGEDSAAGTEPPSPGAGTVADDPDNLITIGPRFGRFTARGRATNVLTLPLGYSFRLKEGGKGLRTVDISLPITYAEIEGGKSGSLFISAGLIWGMNERWSLSPAVSAGVAGSVDLGAAGGVGSASLTSAYTIPIDRYSLSIGNMIGYYETLDIEVGSYNFDPGVSNTVLRNGLMFSVPGTMDGRKVVTEYWWTDTRFYGSDLYSEYYDEFGIAFGLTKTKGISIENHLRAGVSYMTGDGVKGWRINLGYNF